MTDALSDPIEYHLKGISQTQVNEKKGMTFAGHRAVLRLCQAVSDESQESIHPHAQTSQKLPRYRPMYSGCLLDPFDGLRERISGNRFTARKIPLATR
jgi:hypothetical protein